jgi:dienelactone hydrolase
MRSNASSLAVAVIVLAACRPEPAPSPVHSLPVTEFLVKETRLVKGSVSVHLEIPFEPPGPKPVVIALIGNTRPFLKAGIVALTYRVGGRVFVRSKRAPPASEQTVGKWVLASPSAGVIGETYLRDIAATATEVVPAILDWLTAVPEVDATRIGMTGVSTNGFITLQAIAADPRIRAAVVIAACGDYHRFLRYSSMGMEGEPLELEAAYESWLREQEIVRRPDRVVHGALLMLNRVEDELVPVSCADATAEALAAAYERAGAADRFRYVRMEMTGHGIGRAERRETMAWFDEWLLRREPPTRGAAPTARRRRVEAHPSTGSG